jgi:hypothetical protein
VVFLRPQKPSPFLGGSAPENKKTIPKAKIERILRIVLF